MTIYFNSDKEAFAFKIDNFIATIDDETWMNRKQEGWDIINGVYTDISQTQKYKDKVIAKEKEIKNAELQKQIDEIDIKRIRAIVEPSQKDENTTWLQFYTAQIISLRNEIME